jgi:HEAT repeat protein
MTAFQQRAVANQMKHRRIIGIFAAVLLLGAMTWLVMRPRDPMFQRKPESYWFTNITYRAEQEEVDKWKSFGPDGTRILIKALKKGNGPLERSYSKLWPKLPGLLRNRLPKPVDSTAVRMCAADMLGRMRDAKMATPIFMQTLEVEKSEGVRVLLIFRLGEYLPEMNERQKKKLFPEFVQAMQSRHWGMRNNAALALKYYPEQKEVVVPLLVKAVQDPHAPVSMVAAESLNIIDPQAVVNEGVVPILINLLKDPDQQTAMNAARTLGKIRKQPEVVIPTLMEAAQGTNYEVAASSLDGLADFGAEAKAAVPLVMTTLRHKDGRMRYAAAYALKQIDPEAAAKAGVK